MDPFTEKLLARTQARKAALAKKREEVAGRSPVVTPRQPLTETNSKSLGSNPIKTESSDSTTPKKLSCRMPIIVKATQNVAGSPRSVHYEKFAKQTSLAQKECFIELGEAKNALKPTPKKRELDQNSVSSAKIASDEPKLKKLLKDDISTPDSPSVKDRKAMFLKQVEEDANALPNSADSHNANQSEKTAQKVTALKSVDAERVFPSMREPRANLCGGRFFNDPRRTSSDSQPLKVPTKPPRVAVTAKSVDLDTTAEQKNSQNAPTKLPRSSQSGTPSHQDVPPISKSDPLPQNSNSSTHNGGPLTHNRNPITQKYDSSTPLNSSPGNNGVLPTKPPRILSSESKSNDESNVKQSNISTTLKRPAPLPPTTDSTDKSSNSDQKESKRFGKEVDNIIPAKKPTPENSNINDAKTGLVSSSKDTILSPEKYLIAPTGSPAKTVKESTPTQEGEVRKDEFQRSLKAQKISAISLNEFDTSMNSHEITFNISMTEFDQALENEKKAMFQMTYDESVKKAEGIQKNEEFCNDDHEMTTPVQAIHKGVHKSGYHSSYSDQYAAVVTPKKLIPKTTRNFTVHEKIQMLLEEAAYQQNIVLQASQAVNTCLALHDGVSYGSSEEVEAERLLRFSTERRTACLDEVQKLKTSDEDEATSMNGEDLDKDQPCKATLKISGIKIPIDKQMLQNQTFTEAACTYSLICIVKHTPNQMFCTKAVSWEEINNGCIVFDDTFEITNVEPSFELDIRVFVLKTQLLPVTPQSKHKKKSMIAKRKGSDSSSQGLTPGATQGGPVFRTSCFTLAATAHINLENVYSRKYKMHKVEEKSVLPGNIHVDIECKPEYMNQAKGFLTIFEDVGGLGDWLRYWCVLDGNVLRYWKYPDDDLIKVEITSSAGTIFFQPPLGSIRLSYCVSESVTVVSRDICARPHTMQLVLEKPLTSADRETLISVNTGEKMLIKYMLSADTKADKSIWLNTINDSLKDWRAWHHDMAVKIKQRSQSVDSDVVIV